jgi:hypothetical protein
MKPPKEYLNKKTLPIVLYSGLLGVFEEAIKQAQIDAVNKVKNQIIEHHFSIDNPIIIKASLDIRNEYICSNPLIKPEEIDMQLKKYLIKLLNSLNYSNIFYNLLNEINETTEKDSTGHN